MKSIRLATNTFCVMLLLVAAVYAQRPGGGPPGGGPGRAGSPAGPQDGFRPPRPGPDGPPPHGQRPPPLGPQAGFLSSEMRFGDRVKKGSPYSARFSTENIQTLADGTRITRKSQGAVYRDAEGRTRREQTLDALGPVPMEGGPRQLVFINDPVAGAHYVIDVLENSARKLPFKNPPKPGGPKPSEMHDPPDEVVVESLGKQTIEGVEAEGTRTTVTVPAGRIGNDRPLKIVTERWFSPELGVPVLSKHNDPFAGQNVYRLTSIQREEPAASLFLVPSEYRVILERPPDGPPRPRQ